MQFFSRVELPMVNYHVGFLALSASRRQIFGYLPVFSSRKLHSLGFFLIAHLVHFFAYPINCFCFCFGGSVDLTIGLAIGGAVLIA